MSRQRAVVAAAVLLLLLLSGEVVVVVAWRRERKGGREAYDLHAGSWPWVLLLVFAAVPDDDRFLLHFVLLCLHALPVDVCVCVLASLTHCLAG